MVIDRYFPFQSRNCISDEGAREIADSLTAQAVDDKEEIKDLKKVCDRVADNTAV